MKSKAQATKNTKRNAANVSSLFRVAVGTTIADRPPHGSAGHSFPALCRARVGLRDVLLGPRPSLPSLRRGLLPLFGRFIGTTAQSDSSRACASALGLIAFADRSRSWLEVSRFSCTLFLCVRGFFDYAGSTATRDLSQSAVLLSPSRDGVSTLLNVFFEDQSPGPPIPLSTL